MKKGEGLSMSVIVVAALGALILVILTALILKAVGNLQRVDECRQVNGYCEDDDGSPNVCGEGYVINRARDCGEGKVCCMPIGGSSNG